MLSLLPPSKYLLHPNFYAQCCVRHCRKTQRDCIFLCEPLCILSFGLRDAVITGTAIISFDPLGGCPFSTFLRFVWPFNVRSGLNVGCWPRARFTLRDLRCCASGQGFAQQRRHFWSLQLQLCFWPEALWDSWGSFLSSIMGFK